MRGGCVEEWLGDGRGGALTPRGIRRRRGGTRGAGCKGDWFWVRGFLAWGLATAGVGSGAVDGGIGIFWRERTEAQIFWGTGKAGSIDDAEADLAVVFAVPALEALDVEGLGVGDGIEVFEVALKSVAGLVEMFGGEGDFAQVG